MSISLEVKKAFKMEMKAAYLSIKQASLSGHSPTLKQKRSSQPQLGLQNVFLRFHIVNVRHCPKLQSRAISRKTNGVTLRKWQKL